MAKLSKAAVAMLEDAGCNEIGDDFIVIRTTDVRGLLSHRAVADLINGLASRLRPTRITRENSPQCVASGNQGERGSRSEDRIGMVSGVKGEWRTVVRCGRWPRLVPVVQSPRMDAAAISVDDSSCVVGNVHFYLSVRRRFFCDHCAAGLCRGRSLVDHQASTQECS